MNILITGANGFIGKHLVKKLRSQGHKVQGYDLYWQQDILDTIYLQKFIQEADVVYHLAALVDVQESFVIPQEYYQTNVTGTLNVLYYCLKYGKKLIYPSTAAIYQPYSSPYAHSKSIAEDILKQFLKNRMTILRLFNVYGEGMKEQTMLARFQKENPMTIYGTGEQTRDFISVGDVTSIMCQALQEKWEGRIIDVGTGKSHSVSEIALWFKKPIIYKEKRKEVQESCADITELRKLYHKPFKSLKNALDKMR